MKIKTLEYIHALLIEDERKRREVRDNSRRLQYEYEENNADKKLIKRQTEYADEFMHERAGRLRGARVVRETCSGT